MNVMKIGAGEIQQLVYRDIPVVTFEQIAHVHGVSIDKVRQSFQRHRERFQEGKHFYRLDFKESQILLSVVANPNGTALQLLRLIAAYTGEKQWQVMERVLRQELARHQKTKKI